LLLGRRRRDREVGPRLRPVRVRTRAHQAKERFSEDARMTGSAMIFNAPGDKITLGACAHDCPDTCAWTVTTRDGKAVALRGDKAHPFTRGGLCAKVNHYIERVYSPDRILHPMRRTGRKGEGRFERVSWETALSEIAERLSQLISEHGG